MWITYMITALTGLCIGSFLNVVIYRLPREEGIVFPGSACIHCKKALKWHHNIPLLSFIFLRGQCAFCHQKISWRYPAVEILTALIGVYLLWKFGLTLTFIASCIFSVILIALIFIDLEHQLLPDILTLSLLWLGLLASLWPMFTDTRSAIIGVAIGYLSLWCVAKAYEAFTHREGMGYGDFKLLAALDAWTGWQGLLPIILIASLSGAMVGISLLARRKVTRQTPIPFGPFLAVAGGIVLFFPLY